jgi:carboxylesterase
MPSIKVPALVLHSIEDDITSRWNADYVERHLGGPVTKVLLDDCYHMITVDLQYRRVIELSAQFVEQHTSAVDAGYLEARRPFVASGFCGGGTSQPHHHRPTHYNKADGYRKKGNT